MRGNRIRRVISVVFAALLAFAASLVIFCGTSAKADDVYFPDWEQIGDFADTRKPRATAAPGESENPPDTPKAGETTEKITEPAAIDYTDEFMIPFGLMLIVSVMIFLIALAVVKKREKRA